ncbi:SWR1 complex subunit 2 isoform X2 [Gossypium raimondii]|uniref:SWR1 complex subunit 2 isoform X2 n=1 Tax=Gossypium raimondii TaxID=29730 RepID=UPI00063AAB26|nr:SWR1 complex subunit 2 isoform X2 [Gossypium raimondii]
MGTGKEDTAVFLDRASRSTRGRRRRIMSITKKSQRLLMCLIVTSMKMFEPEPDEEVENDADERFRTKKRLIFPGKPSMKKKKVLSNLDGDSKDENLTQKTSSTQHHDAPDDAEGERIIRKSTRTSVIVRQAERDAIRAALQATMKIVLSGFAAADEQLRLTTMVFKNIFPDIDINTVKLSSCQRIVLLNYNKDTKLIDFRHYSIRLQPVGVSRRIQKFVQNHQVPDLRNLQDFSSHL